MAFSPPPPPSSRGAKLGFMWTLSLLSGDGVGGKLGGSEHTGALERCAVHLVVWLVLACTGWTAHLELYGGCRNNAQACQYD